MCVIIFKHIHLYVLSISPWYFFPIPSPSSPRPSRRAGEMTPAPGEVWKPREFPWWVLGSWYSWTKSGWWFHIFFIFHPYLGNMIQFDEHIFQRGWFNHQPEIIWETFIQKVMTGQPMVNKLLIRPYLWRGKTVDSRHHFKISFFGWWKYCGKNTLDYSWEIWTKRN